MKSPFLVGETIYLRALQESDLNEAYREWLNDDDVCRYNSHHRFPNTDEQMRAYFRSINERNHLVLAICDRQTDMHIGNVALQYIDALNQSAEFAILIGDKAFWGRGVGKEALALMLEHGFSELNLHRVYCGTEVRNIGMRKLAKAAGFKEEGSSRDAIFKGGSFRTIINFGLLRNEYKRKERTE